MKINVVLNELDYNKLQLYWGVKNNEFKKFRITILIIYSIIFSLIYFLSLYFFNLHESGYIYIIYFFYIIISIFLIDAILVKNSYKKVVSKNLNKIYSNLYGILNYLTIENDLLIYESPFSKLEIKYENVEFVEELQDYFYIKIKSSLRIILPKVSFKSIDDYKLLKNILIKNNITIINEKNFKF